MGNSKSKKQKQVYIEGAPPPSYEEASSKAEPEEPPPSYEKLYPPIADKRLLKMQRQKEIIDDEKSRQEEWEFVCKQAIKPYKFLMYKISGKCFYVYYGTKGLTLRKQNVYNGNDKLSIIYMSCLIRALLNGRVGKYNPEDFLECYNNSDIGVYLYIENEKRFFGHSFLKGHNISQLVYLRLFYRNPQIRNPQIRKKLMDAYNKMKHKRISH